MSPTNTVHTDGTGTGTGTGSSTAGPSTPACSTREPTWKHPEFYGCPEAADPAHLLRRQSQSFDLDLEDYFEGPRDVRHFTRVPLCLRLYGSVLPKMVLPLLGVTAWAATVVAVCQYVHDLGIDSILLTVLGFIVGLSLSFRFSTAYERYNDGSKYWSALVLNARIFAKVNWIFVRERHDVSEDLGKADLLAKLSAINLLNAFAVAVKHRLRFEPATQYVDLAHLVAHLDTMAGAADQRQLIPKPKSNWVTLGEYLGVREVDPREALLNSNDNLGNLPLEILLYLSTYMKHVVDQKLLDGLHQGTAMGCITNLTDILGGLERISDTPIPVAYSIAIAQVTWVYVLLLPMQLWHFLGWLTIPGTLFAAYIILSFERIGREIENPFGADVNDLPLDQYCHDLAADFDILTRAPAPDAADSWLPHARNKVMYPLSMRGHDTWSRRSLAEIREALRFKASTRGRTRVKNVTDENTPLLEQV